MSLTQILKPTIEPNDIVYHVDDIREDSYRQLEDNVGWTYPSIRFRNSVVHYINIQNFTLTVGRNFLPKLSISFRDDTEQITDTDYPIQNDIVTILLGNTKDQANKPIHSNFNILNCSVNKDTRIVSVNAELSIPDWRTSYIRSFGQKTKFDALKDICKELGLGLISNVSLSNDLGLRNQNGVSNATYLQSLCDTIWTSSNHRFWCFVDANYNLNVIDLMTMISEPDIDETVNFNLRTGELLEKPERIVITNDAESAENVQFRIKAWNPINNSGSMKYSTPTAIRHSFVTKDYENNTFTENTIDNLIQDESNDAEIDIYSSFEDATTFESNATSIVPEFENQDGSAIAFSQNQLGKNMILNSMNIETRLVSAAYLLYIGRKLPVNIFNSPSGSPEMNRDSETGNKTSISSQSIRNQQVENKMFTGWYSIIGITYNYVKSNEEMFMTLLMTKRLWYEQYANKISE